MRKDIAGEGQESTTPVFEVLESLVREQAQAFIQQILEEEVTDAFDEPVTLANIMAHAAGFEDLVLELFGDEPEDVQIVDYHN